MKRTIITILAFLFLFLFISCNREKDLYFFYLELCPSCEQYVAAEKLAEQVKSQGGHVSNIINDEDAAAMKNVLEAHSLGDISHSLPLLIEGGEYFVGYEEITLEVSRLVREK